MKTTTLAKIRGLTNYLDDDFIELCEKIGAHEDDNRPIFFSEIAGAIGVDYAIWCLRTMPDYEKEARLFAADCAERVLYMYENKYPEDKTIRNCLQAARDFANGKIDKKELEAFYFLGNNISTGILDNRPPDYIKPYNACHAAMATIYNSGYRAAYEAAQIAREIDPEEKQAQIKLLTERFG